MRMTLDSRVSLHAGESSRVHLFENHDEAYRIWAAAGYRRETIVHVDAHHDLTWLDDSVHLEVGNYLCQALKDGIAQEIYWVVPDGALAASSVRSAIVAQLRRLRSTYPGPRQSLSCSRVGITTALCDARLIVCELDALSGVGRHVLLDLDTDFLLTPAARLRSGLPADAPWLRPADCVARLEP